MSSFFRGMRFALAGVMIFYRGGTWWKYAAKVWGVLFIFYAGVVWLIFRLAAMTADLLGGRLGALPAFLRSLLEGSLTVTAFLVAAVVILTTLSPLFEIFGNLFFDRMTADFEERFFHVSFAAPPLRRQIRLTAQALGFALVSALIFLLLLPAGFLLPPVGFLLIAAVMGRRAGLSLLFAPGFLRGQSVREIVALFRRRRGELLGFGITVYFSQLLPFTLPLTLPGVILGAVMLYHGTFPAVPPEERRKVTEKDWYLP